MNGAGYLFSLVASAMLLGLPRRWAPLPLLMGAAYMTPGQELEIGPLHFPVIRLLIAVGFLRVLAKGERIAGGLNVLDRIMVLWAIWAAASSLFHVEDSLVTRLGMILNALGAYLLFRVFVQDTEDIRNTFRMVCILLVPLAGALLVEKLTGRNCFAVIGGISEEVAVRHGRFRARGPFAHAILAGTVGAVCFPLALAQWRQNRRVALAGLAATGSIVFASGASGPVMTVLSILVALALWRVRDHLRMIRWGAVLLVLALAVAMKDPVYYLLARIDITGGSTGWHRAALIKASIDHLGEWWLAGTDYTREWMPTGVEWNTRHTDITNHYIAMGVWGGLPLLLLFWGVLVAAFALVGRALRATQNGDVEQQFLIWTLGAILFGHTATFLSVSYFDQSVVFFYLLLACIGSIYATTAVAAAVHAPEAPEFEAVGEASMKHGQDLCHHC